MSKHSPYQRGFTTIELLVVIGIIVLLISLLIPVVGKVQQAARTANTRAFLSQLSLAIEQYYQDFKGYPGPLSNDEIRLNTYGNAFPGALHLVRFAYATPWPTDFAMVSSDAADGRYKITMAENLVLGLLGGLKLVATSSAGTTFDLVYDPTLVGKGPLSLNPAQPKSFSPYIEVSNLSWQTLEGKRTGAFYDEASIGANTASPTGADDSIIPEFVDRYGDPMPILYLRAKVGARVDPPPSSWNKNRNPIITQDLNATQTPRPRPGAYDISQIIGYTKPANSGDPAIGVGRKSIVYYADGNRVPAGDEVHGLNDVNLEATMGPVGGPGYYYPYNAFPFFRDPSLSNAKVGGADGNGYQAPHVPRQKDKFILISAGPDRIYGTDDDLTSFGSVVP